MVWQSRAALQFRARANGRENLNKHFHFWAPKGLLQTIARKNISEVPEVRGALHLLICTVSYWSCWYLTLAPKSQLHYNRATRSSLRVNLQPNGDVCRATVCRHLKCRQKSTFHFLLFHPMGFWDRAIFLCYIPHRGSVSVSQNTLCAVTYDTQKTTCAFIYLNYHDAYCEF